MGVRGQVSNPYPRSFVLSWPEPRTEGFCLAPACTPSLLGWPGPAFQQPRPGGAGPVAGGSRRRADARAPAGRRPGGPVARGVSGTSAAWVVSAPLLRSLHAAPPVHGPWHRLRNSALSRPSQLPQQGALLPSSRHIWNQLPWVSAGAGCSRRSGEWKTRPPSWHRPQLPPFLSPCP